MSMVYPDQQQQMAPAQPAGGNVLTRHPLVALGIGVLLAILLFMLFSQKQASSSSTASAPTTGDTSGLPTDANGNPIEFVPTSNNFETITSNTTSGSYNNTTTNNQTVDVPGPPPPPTPAPEAQTFILTQDFINAFHHHGGPLHEAAKMFGITYDQLYQANKKQLGSNENAATYHADMVLTIPPASMPPAGGSGSQLPPPDPGGKPPVDIPPGRRVITTGGAATPLWLISLQQYGNPLKWAQIAQANTQTLGQNASSAPAGTKLIIP